MEFKIITSLNKRLFEHKTQKLIDSVIEQKYPITLYHENSYENTEIDFPKSNLLTTIDLWQLPEYSFWIENFINSKQTPWNNDKYLSIHPSTIYKKTHAKYWFRKVLSISHAILNAKTEYVIWCDGDAHFVNQLDNAFWSYVKQFNITCIYRDTPHIESGFVVYKINEHVKKLMREYIGYYSSGDVWKYPRWCDGSVLTYLLKDEKFGKFKNKEYRKNDTSNFDISYYFNHIKDPFKEVRGKE